MYSTFGSYFYKEDNKTIFSCFFTSSNIRIPYEIHYNIKNIVYKKHFNEIKINTENKTLLENDNCQITNLPPTSCKECKTSKKSAKLFLMHNVISMQYATKNVMNSKNVFLVLL